MTKPRDALPDDSYVDKLGKILPAELTATYFFIRTLAGDDPRLTLPLLLLALVLCAAFYLIAPKLLKMNVPFNRALYSLTFVTWFLAIDPSRFATDLFRMTEDDTRIIIFVASGVAAIWSFIVPHLMKQEGA